MPYVPDAEDDTQPLITEIAKTAAAEFRTIKTYLKTLRDVPKIVGSWKRGYCRVEIVDTTINTADLVEGYTYSFYNASDADVDILQGAGVTLRLAGTLLTGHRNVAPRGLVSLWCNSGTEVVAIGAGLS